MDPRASKPRAREKKVVDTGAGVERREEEGLGTGPVSAGQVDTSARAQQIAREGGAGQQRPASPFAPFNSANQPNRSPRQNSAPGGREGASSQRPPVTGGGVRQNGTASGGTRQNGTNAGGVRQNGTTGAPRTPVNSAPGPSQRPPVTGGGVRQNGTVGGGTRQNGTVGGGTRQNGTVGGGTRQNGTNAGGTRGGGGSKLLILIVAAVVLFFGGRSFFSGNDSGNILSGNDSGNSLLSGNNSGSSNTYSSGSGTSNSSTLPGGDSSIGSGGLSNLLSAFTGSAGSSIYDFSGILGSLSGGTNGGYNGGSASLPGGSQGNVSNSSGGLSDLLGGYFSSSSSAGNISQIVTGGSASGTKPDTTVAAGARSKYTNILGGKKDTVTIMVYMCGADLESRSGMATSDIKEMTNASIGDNINLIVYTGGSRKWRNNVISNTTNQIFQIKDGGIYCLEKDAGDLSMTSPSTLSSFIKFCAENFPANRNELIFWDHGGGSLSGFGNDERHSGSTMTLSGINTALKNGGVKFDFVGFDTCLMATVENGLMIEKYADYMIASEESEPGVGWYYTNWLSKFSANTSMKTVDIGKIIADDFVDVCNQKCRGQATTLSVVDLAELAATVPAELTDFSIATSEMISNNEYKKVSNARYKTREFAQSAGIDQIDLIHFAENIGTKAGKELAEALRGAIKYNRTNGAITNANGLSIYFPLKRVGKVSQAVATYKDIGMDTEYTRCIQEFASMETSGQAVSSYTGYGIPLSGSYDISELFGSSGSSGSGSYNSSYGASSLFGSSDSSGSLGGSSLMNSLLGSLASGSQSGNISAGGMESLLEGLFGGGSSSLDFFGGRTLTASQAAEYIAENHFDATELNWVWDGKAWRIPLSDSNWENTQYLVLNVFYDDGKGFIDMGTDNVCDIDGNDLIASDDGTWISINGQPVAYYYLNTTEIGDDYAITGAVPVLLNGERAELILIFDSERPEGYIAGARSVYSADVTAAEGKTLIQVGAGDTLDFLCDYYSYDGKFIDAYPLGKQMVLGDKVEIANTPLGDGGRKAAYCFVDIYQQQYWSPTIPEAAAQK